MQAILRYGESRHQTSPHALATSNLAYCQEKKKPNKTPNNEIHKQTQKTPAESNSVRGQKAAVLAIFRGKNIDAAIQASPLPQHLYCIKKQHNVFIGGQTSTKQFKLATMYFFKPARKRKKSLCTIGF